MVTHEELWLSPTLQEQIILACSIASILFGLYNVYSVLSIKILSRGSSASGDVEVQEAGAASDEEV